MKVGMAMLLVMVANAAFAGEPPRVQSANTQRVTVAPEGVPTAPVLTGDARWVVGLLIVVVAMVVAAGVIGPIYRMSLPDEISVNYSHDEPPGSSHHHGPSGTLEFSPPENAD
jgi:hypothetical protein